MHTTKISSLRHAVIALLKRSGRSPIVAVEEWDSIYSKQIQQAKPGKHILHIGAYTLEYTKPPVDPFEVIAQEHTEAVKLESQSRTLSWVKLIAVLIIVIALIFIVTQVFEDGSFIILGFIKGCLPWAVCN